MGALIAMIVLALIVSRQSDMAFRPKGEVRARGTLGDRGTELALLRTAACNVLP